MNKLNSLAKGLKLRGGAKDETDERDIFAEVKKIAPAAVVNVEVTYPRDFGYTFAMSTKATGFVVDKEKGIILSNKHVVQEGPCRAKGLFLKHEEVDIFPIYRDPVHDYGFFRFDPSQLKDTPLTEIKLAPEKAKTGMKTLLIGNNEGEKLTFIEATISRLDRPALQGLDLNTFYITTSDTSVGGTSGSPLLSKEGEAIAMMSAGAQTTSFFLPLHRIARALEYLQKDQKPPRGTLQVGFKYHTFEALLKRKAINQKIIDDAKAAVEKPEGMLVVDKNLPKGPGRKGGIESGDVLLKMNGKIITNYIAAAEIMDTFIGKDVDLDIVRHLETKSIKAKIQDHADIEVGKLVEVSNGVFHQLQYAAAVNQNLPMEGVFVAKSGYMFSAVPRMSIIKKIGSTEIKNLSDFVNCLKTLRNGDITSVRFQMMYNQTQVHRNVITVDKRWYPFQVATRNDKAGKWEYKDVKDESPPIEIHEKKSDKAKETEAGEKTEEDDINQLVNSVVTVKSSKPFNVDGAYDASWVDQSSAIIINKDLGLILATSANIPRSLADVQLVFNGSKIIPAKILYISPDPQIPAAFLQYDTALLEGDESVTVCDVTFSEERPEVGEKLEGVGVSNGNELQRQECKVRSFRAGGGVEYVDFDKFLQGSGVFIEKKSKLVKIFSIGWGGLMIACDFVPLIKMITECVKTGSAPPQSVNILPVTIVQIELAEARVNDLSYDWTLKLQKTMTPYQRKLITFKQRMVTSDAYDKLMENDIVLSVDETPVTLIREYYTLLRNKEKVKIRVLRDSEEIDVEVKLHKFSTLGTTRIIHFAGLILQDPHPALYYNTKPEFLQNGGVYITHKEYGSPVESSESQQNQYVETAGKLIFKVDDTETLDLDEFSKAITRVKHREFVRLSVRAPQNGEEAVLDVRLDLEYWKSRDMFLNEKNDWESKFITHDS